MWRVRRGAHERRARRIDRGPRRCRCVPLSMRSPSRHVVQQRVPFAVMPGFLLRVLLCISLILGGANSSVAGVRSHAMHAQAVEADARPRTEAPATDAPCHAAASDERPGTRDPSGNPSVQDVQSGPHGSHCCEPGHCEGACVQLAQAELSSRGFHGSIPAGVPPASGRESVHAAPDPQHLIRPPIG